MIFFRKQKYDFYELLTRQAEKTLEGLKALQEFIDDPSADKGFLVQELEKQADELRPEMPLGHAYLLARGPLPETGFVYVLVSKQQASQLQGLKPLDEMTATVTVRTARTRYLATPVVEVIRMGSGR